MTHPNEEFSVTGKACVYPRSCGRFFAKRGGGGGGGGGAFLFAAAGGTPNFAGGGWVALIGNSNLSPKPVLPTARVDWRRPVSA